MGEGRGKGGVGRGKGRGSTRLLGVLPAARRRQVGVHRVARALGKDYVYKAESLAVERSG